MDDRQTDRQTDRQLPVNIGDARNGTGRMHPAEVHLRRQVGRIVESGSEASG